MSLFTISQTAQAIGAPYAFGFRDLLVLSLGPETVLWASTGSGGGLAAFTLDPDGDLAFSASFDYPSFIRAGVDPSLALTGESLVVGGLMGSLFELGGDAASGKYAALGSPTLSLIAPLGITLSGADHVLAGVPSGGTWLHATTPGGLSPLVQWSPDTLGAAVSLPGGYLAMAFPGSDRVEIMRPAGTGQPQTVSSVSADDGLGWSLPSHAELVVLNDRTFLLVGSKGSSSLTVLGVGADGGLAIADHVIDSQDTRFAGVPALDGIVIGGQAFVAAGGNDDGITLFHLLPNGRLVPLQTIVDDLTTGLTNVTSVALYAFGDQLRLTAASEGDAGLTVFAAPIAALPQARMGTDGDETIVGTNRADTIHDGAGSDVMTGRGGADIFLIAADGRQDRITDFTLGTDRIDLSLFEGIYDLGDFTMSATATGLRVEIAGEVLIVDSAGGGPIDPVLLDRSDLFGADRPPLSLVGDTIVGGASGETLTGGIGGDLIDGRGGDDLLDGGFGDDRVSGGEGNDSLTGGDGRDVLTGGVGDDLIEGGPGSDSLFGGEGDDTLTGGTGNDYLGGGPGDDALDGGEGQDILRGGSGADRLDGGQGADRLDGGPGDDLLIGGAGSDIFAMAPGGGTDRIADFEAGDLIDLMLLEIETVPEEVLATYGRQDGDDFVIDFGEEALVLANLTATDLGVDDFLL